MDKDHRCTKYDQLNTCVECGAEKNPMPTARFSGGAGATTQPLSDEDYKREMAKLTGGR